MPSRFFNCEPIIMSDVADVNALVTGTDIKSTMKPTSNAQQDSKTNKKEKKKNKNIVKCQSFPI